MNVTEVIHLFTPKCAYTSNDLSAQYILNVNEKRILIETLSQKNGSYSVLKKSFGDLAQW